jgi:PAS domain S-box-containing protein
MQFQYTPYIFPLIAAAIISMGVAFYTWSRRSANSGPALTILSFVLMEWLLGYALEIAGADLTTKIIWGKMQYIGIAALPLFWVIFAFNYANQNNRLSHRVMGLLAILPLVTIVLAFTTEAHGLIWKKIQVTQAGTFSALDVSYGWWFWVHSAYSYILLMAGTILMIRSLIRSQGLYRGQATALLVAVVVPWIGNALYLTGLSPIQHLDLTPFAFTITIVALAWGIFGFRLVDIVPVARDIVVEEMKDGMIVLDTQSRIVDINTSGQLTIGKSAAELIGKNVSDALQAWPQLTDRYANVVDAQDEISIGEGENRRWFELRFSPLYDRRKRFVGRVVTLRDITDRKQTEEHLSQLSRAVEASPTSIVITTPDGKIQYVNPKFTRVTGYTLEEALGQNPRILKTEYTGVDVHRQLWETINSGKEWHGEFCNRKKNGELYWEYASISPIIDAAGNITHYVAVKEDITERKEIEKALSLAHDQALEASRLKSQLLSRVSHELRTPLGGILGYAELLHDESFGALDETQKDATRQIIDSANYLKEMVNELLDEAQIEARTISLREENFSPAAILQRVEAAMSVLAHNKGQLLTTTLAPDMPVTLWGDEQRLLQILLNLVGNAVKFTKTGKIQVKFYRADFNHWAMQVTDSGIGIPREALSYIFEPFRQVDNAITRENRGTGLGLSITKQLVELMNGQITVESEVEKGSIFTVVLPIVEATENIA